MSDGVFAGLIAGKPAPTVSWVHRKYAHHSKPAGVRLASDEATTDSRRLKSGKCPSHHPAFHSLRCAFKTCGNWLASDEAITDSKRLKSDKCPSHHPAFHSLRCAFKTCGSWLASDEARIDTRRLKSGRWPCRYPALACSCGSANWPCRCATSGSARTANRSRCPPSPR